MKSLNFIKDFFRKDDRTQLADTFVADDLPLLYGTERIVLKKSNISIWSKLVGQMIGLAIALFIVVIISFFCFKLAGHLVTYLFIHFIIVDSF